MYYSTKTLKEIKEQFKKAFDNKPNMITPNKIEYGVLPGGFLYEVSVGTFEPVNKNIYGITIISITGKPTSKSEGGFISFREVRDWLNKEKSKKIGV